MRIPRIYTAQDTAAATACSWSRPQPAHRPGPAHAAGDQLVLFNGEGGEYPASITAVDKKASWSTPGLSERELESALQFTWVSLSHAAIAWTG